MIPTSERPFRIGVALSGGTLKAAAHAGALEALRDLGVNPAMAAGTSAGAVVAALFAHGYARTDYLDLIRHFPGTSLLDYGLPWSLRVSRFLRLPIHLSHRPQRIRFPGGLVRGQTLQRYFRKTLAGRKPIAPFFVLATDLVTGDPVVFSNYPPAVASGRALPASPIEQCLLASCALPGIFRPVCRENQVLVDGALRHYVPVYVLREMGCQKIIVVNLHTLDRDWRPRHLVDVLIRSFDVLLRETIEDDMGGDDVYVVEPSVQGMNWTSLQRLEDSFYAGYEAVISIRQRLLTWIHDGPPIHRRPPLQMRRSAEIPPRTTGKRPDNRKTSAP
ncbi:patatin-like phospholipase family protein [Alicyclobacillus shizuokensis]|uniref:patatin-like phospholipase family protein n=1 Tax=Alicyclobacillus shizuokensis TaxID=392014 RepID=UPI00082FA958|nr:patatin-like phospholipase family protein [Alicyclobacillus shizuokensis]MCL6625687.1 patatin-like phospholipase family protein [Alicyclobacillus shizuokensis]